MSAPKSLSPLILVVGDAENETGILSLFQKAEYVTFAVSSHTEALEWVGALPFCAIAIVADRKDIKSSILYHLRSLTRKAMMADIPVWVITAKSEKYAGWKKAGASEIMLLPPGLSSLCALRNRLPSPNHRFYSEYDHDLRSDLPRAIRARLKELNKDLAELVIQAQRKMAAASHASSTDDSRHIIHAVKSVALSLGYFRLAALMTESERAIVTHGFRGNPENWLIILECLRISGFREESPTAFAVHQSGSVPNQRGVVSS